MPWRRRPGTSEKPDPFRVWLSEVMLQQTRVDQALPYFERFLQTFPTVGALAAATTDEVLKRWEGLGYYSRARNLHRAAQIVQKRHGGRLPETVKELRNLPGIGPYTANAIASIAFGQRAPVVEGNVVRVLARVFNVKEPVNDAAMRRRLWGIAEGLVPKKSPGDFNQALMELGARICTPRAPKCSACPLCGLCEARAAGVEDVRPVRLPKTRIPRHEIVVAVIKRHGRYLLGKRPSKGLLGGLWEFPGGKVRRGESHRRALIREIREEIGLGVKVGELIASARHAYSHFTVTLHVYRCTPVRGRPKPCFHTALRWVPKAHFSRYAFPKANHKFLNLL